jgi:glycerol uptake facilitator-like aquaporin
MRSKLASEFFGTAVLLIAVVGSSFMGANLTSDKALALLINAAVTAAILGIIIKTGSPISGAHFNPLVTIALLIKGSLRLQAALGYLTVQVMGGISGVIIANLMFTESAFESSSTLRSGSGQWIGEIVATAGLIYLALTSNEKSAWKLIPLWIFAAYFFTSSTSFANPAVTIARIFTNAPAGIDSASVLGFIAAQIVGTLLVLIAIRKRSAHE